MKKVLSTLALFAMLLAFAPASPAHAASIIAPAQHTSTSLSYGSLIRGETFPAVYYWGEDGFRYTFPNDKTYFTWYSNFDDVTTISDALLGSIQIGGNVTYNPGVKLVKITTDPKTYAVGKNGTLRWVTSEDVAESMLGSEWNTQIDDVPDAFFSNYTVGEPLETALNAQAFQMQFLAHDDYTITDDKNLTAFVFMDIVDMAFFNPEDHSTTVTIDAGKTIMFANVDDVNHTFTADDGSWGTGTLTPLQSYVLRFSTPGTYAFHCSYHPDMTGTVIVQ